MADGWFSKEHAAHDHGRAATLLSVARLVPHMWQPSTWAALDEEHAKQVHGAESGTVLARTCPARHTLHLWLQWGFTTEQPAQVHVGAAPLHTTHVVSRYPFSVVQLAQDHLAPPRAASGRGLAMWQLVHCVAFL